MWCGVLAVGCGVAAGLTASLSLAAGRTWNVTTHKGASVSGTFTNGNHDTVTGVSLRGTPANSVTSFVFNGKSCALDKQGGAGCATGISLATGKSASFRFTTKKPFKSGVMGCYTVTRAAPTTTHPQPGNSPPSPGAPSHSPAAHCEPIQVTAAAQRAARPKLSAKAKAHMVALVGLAVTNELKAIADLKARHTTLARGALIKSIAELNAAQLAGAHFETGDAGHDLGLALGTDRTVLDLYTESPSVAELAKAEGALKDAVAAKRAAIKILRALK
jgi:hypothetical protein